MNEDTKQIIGEAIEEKMRKALNEEREKLNKKLVENNSSA